MRLSRLDVGPLLVIIGGGLVAGLATTRAVTSPSADSPFVVEPAFDVPLAPTWTLPTLPLEHEGPRLIAVWPEALSRAELSKHRRSRRSPFDLRFSTAPRY